MLTGLGRQCLLGWADSAYSAGPTVLNGLGRQCLMGWADNAYWAGPTVLTALGRQCLLGWADSAYCAGPTVLTGLGRQCLLGWADGAYSAGPTRTVPRPPNRIPRPRDISRRPPATWRWKKFLSHHRSTCDMKEIGERWGGMSEEDKDKWIAAPHERDDAM